jgi:hypothetical protein
VDQLSGAIWPNDHVQKSSKYHDPHKYVTFPKRAPGLLYPWLNYSHEILGRFLNIIDKLSDARSLPGHAQGHPASRKLKLNIKVL